MGAPLKVVAGGVQIGGGAPVTIQSMTNTPTEDVAATRRQIDELVQEGCQIVRISVYSQEAALAIPQLKRGLGVPLVADIHFDYRLALLSIKNGVDKLRFNPGNIGSEKNVLELCAAAKGGGIPIRVGVNSGSVERELLAKYGGPTPEALAESALRHVAILERAGFYNTVISVKASSVPSTVSAYRAVAERCQYPLHVGVTEAGSGQEGLVKGAMGIGALLLAGVGDTIRVSLTGNPVAEVHAAKQILAATGLRREGVEVVSCPTCGRCCVDLEAVVSLVKRELKGEKPLKVAVMGCAVNGPGEAREADIGVAFGPGGGVVFKKGEQLFTAPAESVVQRFIEEAKQML